MSALTTPRRLTTPKPTKRTAPPRTTRWLTSWPERTSGASAPDAALLVGKLGTADQAIVAAVDATVVVATRDRVDSLRRTLRALAAQRTERDWEIVVVDDGSSPPVPDDLDDAPSGLRLV